MTQILNRNILSHRERLIRSVLFQDADELPFRLAYGLMPGLLEEWHKQGLPSSVKSDADVREYFGFPAQDSCLPLNLLFDPPFEHAVLEETAEYKIERDWMGRRTKLIKAAASIPLPMDFPVRDMDSWLGYKSRLVYSEKRMGSFLEETARRNIETGRVNKFGAMGFFWFPRDLMGDENLCAAYYEDPGLVQDILETWGSLLERVLTETLRRVKIDIVHLGEDMAYKTSSMIGKDIFDRFMRPHYQRIHNILREFDAPVFSVDSDGCLRELAHWFSGCGVNYIGPNEVGAGNDITEYRKIFGKRMAYDGGLEKQTLRKTRKDIDEMLEKTIPFMKATGGGWSVCLDHRVLEGTPLENFQYFVSRTREMVKF
jgi:hypothetical protein